MPDQTGVDEAGRASGDAITRGGAARRTSDRIVGADGVRALAALGVIFSHLFQRLAMPLQPDWYQQIQAVLMHGAFGVSAFFVLSGMLLSLPFWRAYLRGDAMPSLRHYARRRAARIVPAYYAALLVSFAVTFLIDPDAPHLVWRLVAGLTFTSSFHYVTFFPSAVNGPLWSIGFEVVSYVLLPAALAALFWWRARRRARAAARPSSAARGLAWWVATFAVTIGLNEIVVTAVRMTDHKRGWEFGDVGGAKEWMPGYNPLGFFGHFLVGVLAAWAIAAWRHRIENAGSVRPSTPGEAPPELTRWWWDAVGLAGFAAGALILWRDRWPAEPQAAGWFQGQPYLFPLFALAVALTLVGLAHSRMLGRLVDNRFARYTATVSFGLYVWHYLVLYWISFVSGGQFEYMGVADWGQHLWTCAAVLVISYVVATLSWRHLERPVLRSRWANRA